MPGKPGINFNFMLYAISFTSEIYETLMSKGSPKKMNISEGSM